MSTSATRNRVTISVMDLENMIRRVVREVVHEELAQHAQGTAHPMLDDWSQEGPDDPTGDEVLLAEAMATLAEYQNSPESWITLQDLEAELDRAEAAGELPG